MRVFQSPGDGCVNLIHCFHSLSHRDCLGHQMTTVKFIWSLTYSFNSYHFIIKPNRHTHTLSISWRAHPMFVVTRVSDTHRRMPLGFHSDRHQFWLLKSNIASLIGMLDHNVHSFIGSTQRILLSSWHTPTHVSSLGLGYVNWRLECEMQWTSSILQSGLYLSSY